ncbi:hypothetical protein [Phreatobacter stygius]|uniref:Lipoprotein n=1 Tax=Phreatobacter stygius TaxID=1940610 RepID=A0A4D7B4Q0_9HYPH|nr:hypothetical protein [Phreatobacter stygius]QCI67921.1 hypothetical protein E8M01_29030 [Phreatobacter stygius]
MTVVPRFLTHATLIAGPTAMFLAACTLLLMMTSPGRAEPSEPRRIEIRGGESIEVPGADGRVITLRFTRVINDGRCAAATCARTGSPVVEIQALGTSARTPTFRLSPAAHLAAPFVPVQGRFVAFGELVSPPRELTTAGRPTPLGDYVLRLTVTP